MGAAAGTLIVLLNRYNDALTAAAKQLRVRLIAGVVFYPLPAAFGYQLPFRKHANKAGLFPGAVNSLITARDVLEEHRVAGVHQQLNGVGLGSRQG